jgi:hypothetical protein
VKPCEHCRDPHSNARFCSYSCRNAVEWAALTKSERSAKGKRMAQARVGQSIARMLQRVKAMAHGEDARLILAYRYGLGASKVRRYRLHRNRAQAS